MVSDNSENLKQIVVIDIPTKFLVAFLVAKFITF